MIRGALLLVSLISISSCDHAKKIVSSAASSIKKKLAAAGGAATNSVPDPALQKLVDDSADGVAFRKDLPFPKQVEIRVVTTREFDTRRFSSSELGRGSTQLRGSVTSKTTLKRDGDHIDYAMQEMTFSPPISEKPVDPKTKVESPVPLDPPEKFAYQKSNGSWQSQHGNSFRAVSISRNIAPVFDQLLAENALAPRKFWFGKRRFKAGDAVTVSGDQLPMLITGSLSGSLSLVFQGQQAIAGHPCGVFSLKGNYSCRETGFNGTTTDADITVESGKIWLSLLHPMVLQIAFEGISSTKSGGAGNLLEREQGKIKVSVMREWKAR